MLKVLVARRAYLSLLRKGKRAKPPRFETVLPVMVRQDCYGIHQLASGTWVLKFPVSSGRSQIAVPIAVSCYHTAKIRDLAGGSCRQGSMELRRGKDGNWYASVTLI